MPITLSDEARTALVADIRHYFLEERGEEIGELAAGFLLDFMTEHLGPSIYNQAVRDAQARLQAVVTDLDVHLYAPEPPR